MKSKKITTKSKTKKQGDTKKYYISHLEGRDYSILDSLIEEVEDDVCFTSKKHQIKRNNLDYISNFIEIKLYRGIAMNRKEVIYFYPRDEHGKRTGHTIAIVLKEGLMFYGEALCSKADQFCKKTGRELAKQRAEEKYLRYKERIEGFN